MMGRLALLFLLLVPGTAALAHETGEGAEGGWFNDIPVDFLIATAVILYVLGLVALLRDRPGARRPVPPWRIAAFAAAMAILIIALLSPFEARADESFSWHMAQHLLLMSVAAPLLSASNAHLVMIRAFPLKGRRAIGRSLSQLPGVRQGAHSALTGWLAFICFSAALWLWHLPGPYDRAVESDWLHALEHMTFLFTSLAFWRVVATSGDRRLGIGTAVVMVSLIGLEGAMLGALITLAPRPLYPVYAAAPDALQDQIAAGVLMWVPAGLIYIASSVIALGRLFAGPRRMGRLRPASVEGEQ
jgi:putative membrane protein